MLEYLAPEFLSTKQVRVKYTEAAGTSGSVPSALDHRAVNLDYSPALRIMSDAGDVVFGGGSQLNHTA